VDRSQVIFEGDMAGKYTKEKHALMNPSSSSASNMSTYGFQPTSNVNDNSILGGKTPLFEIYILYLF